MTQTVFWFKTATVIIIEKIMNFFISNKLLVDFCVLNN